MSGVMTRARAGTGSVERGTRRFLRDYSAWGLLVLAVIWGTFQSGKFLTASNFFAILTASGFLGCLVLAQSFVLLTGHFDLSTETNMVFVSIVAGLLVTPRATGSFAAGGGGIPWPVVIVIMFAIATLTGLINGLLVVKLRMNAFMVTLAMSIVLGGLSLVVGQGRNLFGFPAAYSWLGSAQIGQLPVSGIFLVLLFVIGHIIFTRTTFGRSLYAVGSSRTAAQAAGINDDRIIISAFAISGFLCGVAGLLLSGELGSASPSMSTGALFLSVAAAVIGGVSLFGGQGTAAGMFAGLLLIVTIQNVMNLSSIPSNWVSVVSGGVILVAVFVDGVRVRRFARSS